MATTFDPGSVQLKTEDRDKLGRSLSGIKSEADNAGTHADTHADDDIYEDAGDLDFTESQQSLYLTRLPKYLWKAWDKLGDDVNIEVGRIRVEGSLENPQRVRSHGFNNCTLTDNSLTKMSLMLSDVNTNESVPKEYNMRITNRHTTNTYVFTEKDFPGYSQRTKDVLKAAQDNHSQPFSNASPRLGLQDRARLGGHKVDKGKKLSITGRRAIPKKTAILGQVQTEVSCLPVENKQYRAVMEERAREEEKQKRARETQFLGKATTGGSNLHPSTLGNPSTFNSFIKPTGTQKAKSQDNKAARLPLNELLDKIHQCFKRYKYWPLKALKNEVKQPEAYLRSTLEMVAQLVRTGPHAMTWELKPDVNIPETSISIFDEANSQAPETLGFDGGSDTGDVVLSGDDEEINVAMEDVMPT